MPSSGARLVMKSAAKMRSLPAMPSASAMQASLPLWISAPCRRSSTEILLLRIANMVAPPAGAPAPGVLADPVLVGQFDVAFLDGVEHHLCRHQLHHAGRCAQFVGVLLE